MMDSPTSPFYQWLDHTRIRTLAHDVNALAPGERLVLLKGLVPGLVTALGVDDTDAFLRALATKAQRYEESLQHPGEGRLQREAPGEAPGGPPPDGHLHLGGTRDPDRPGGRAAKREEEAAVWLRDGDSTAAARYRGEVAQSAETYRAAGMHPGRPNSRRGGGCDSARTHPAGTPTPLTSGRGTEYHFTMHKMTLLPFALLLLGTATRVDAQQPTMPMPADSTHRDSTHRTPMPGMSMPGMSTSHPSADRTRMTDTVGRMRGADTTGHEMSAHDMSGHDMTGALGISMQREGSGTSWLPDASPMYARHLEAGGWSLMLHGLAFVQYDKQGYTHNSPRESSQFGSVNWGMLMARHDLAGGQLTLRGMMSLEPFTVTRYGYPLLLQSGEAVDGQPLHDRQHPHDLFMELAALYDRPVARDLAVELYAAPVGEPALGPVAFPHRPSAQNDPLAPLGHHWQDATHISFGVLSGGLFTRTVKLEGSIFNGREPDENRTNFDYKGRRLDSYAGRLTVNPSPFWSLSGSFGYLKSPEALLPDISQHRVVASAIYGHPFRASGDLSASLVYGANKESDEDHLSNSVLLESNLNLDRRNAVFGRFERVQKSARDLALNIIGSPPVFVDSRPPFATPAPVSGEQSYDVNSLVLGYVREISSFSGGTIGLGVRGAMDIIPDALRPYYGTRTPVGTTIFVRFRPSAMNMGGMGGMPGMIMGTTTHGHD